MKKNKSIPLGIIEGFFGRSWDHVKRISYAKFLAQHQFDFYIYAPKNDRHLRRNWQEDWPRDQKKEVLNVRKIYAEHNITFGIGLSPLEIWQEKQDRDYTGYLKRLAQLNDLSPDILCILFDDMRGDLPQLAQIQIQLCHMAADISNATKIIFCPSYYSTDPVLEKVFGKMPENYWQDLGQGLDKAIDIFWTGEKVCSESYSPEHLAWIEAYFQRKVFLWDNYPVNDGAIKSQRLHLLPFRDSHHQLKDFINGHAVNPMNQACLSQIALYSLALTYQRKTAQTEQIFMDIAGPQLGQELLRDAEFFQTQGLKDLPDNHKQELLSRYRQFLPNPFAAEVVDWLNGAYAFDPACLTE